MIYRKDNVERIVDNAADARRLESLGFKLKEDKKPAEPVAEKPAETEVPKQAEPEKAAPRRRRRSTKY